MGRKRLWYQTRSERQYYGKSIGTEREYFINIKAIHIVVNKHGYKHRAYNHSAKNWINGMASTNSVESMCSSLKRIFIYVGNGARRFISIIPKISIFPTSHATKL